MENVEEFLSDAQIVILHGGLGKRIKHLTGGKPKGLLEIYDGKTLLDYDIELWSRYCPNLIVLLSPLTRTVVKHIQENYPKLNVQFFISDTELGKKWEIAICDGR